MRRRIVSSLPSIALATGILTTALIVMQVKPAEAQRAFCISMSGASVDCNYNVDTPQNNNYDNTTTLPVYEYSYQRQQKLLQKAITQGQTNQNIGANNLNTNLPNYYNQYQQQVTEQCVNSAYPAYDNAVAAYSDSEGTFSETYQSFVGASNGPYIFDQLQGQNRAFASYSSGQQQLAGANKLDADARSKGLRCQKALAMMTSGFVYNLAQAQSQLLTTQGQLQEQMAAQGQEANSHKAQTGRVANGLQNSMTNALNGLVPKQPTSSVSPRPTKY
jgi:hypothetical protein